MYPAHITVCTYSKNFINKITEWQSKDEEQDHEPETHDNNGYERALLRG